MLEVVCAPRDVSMSEVPSPGAHSLNQDLPNSSARDSSIHELWKTRSAGSRWSVPHQCDTRRGLKPRHSSSGPSSSERLCVWLLMAGEIYTTFTFLGASGWAYSRGAPILFNFGQAPLIYVTSFYILPLFWEVGRKHQL